MRRSWFGLLVVGGLLTTTASADDSKDEAIKKDRKQIEGTWRIVTFEDNGKKRDTEKVTIVNGSDGTWSFRQDGKEISKGTSTIDPTKKPKTIDFTITKGEGEGIQGLGIYELGEKTRKICFGEKRPTEFSSKVGSGQVLITFEREKAK
jgi:uncharacterized protein (TIGR03067 family)